jgi:hypothetical protein
MPPTPTPELVTALLHVQWPASTVPILPSQPIEVALVAPPGVAITASVLSSVLDPTGERYGLFALRPLSHTNPPRYVSETPLQFPLHPLDGEWRLAVAIQANVRVTGDLVHPFNVRPPALCVLTDTLHAGVNLSVPRAFEVVVARGTPWAGARVWRYQGGEVALWWAPGPLEPLLASNALVMLETTYTRGVYPEIQRVSDNASEDSDPPDETVLWPGGTPDFTPTAFLFHETWPGPEGGPAEVYVIQGPDHWLYVLRMRAVGQDTIPSLIRQVGQTLTFSD